MNRNLDDWIRAGVRALGDSSPEPPPFPVDAVGRPSSGSVKRRLALHPGYVGPWRGFAYLVAAAAVVLMGVGGVLIAAGSLGGVDGDGVPAVSSDLPVSSDLRMLEGDEVAQLGACTSVDGDFGEREEPVFGPLAHLQQLIDLVRIDGDVLASLERPDPVPYRDLAFLYEFPITVLEGEALTGRLPDQIRVFVDRYDTLAAAAAGRTVVVGVSESDTVLGFIAVVDPAGSIAFVGRCTEEDTNQLAAFRAENPTLDIADGVELLRQLHTDTALLAAFNDWEAGPPPPTWHERDPAERLLHPGDTPDEVLASLEPAFVLWDLGTGWIDLAPMTLCTRIADLGWNDCLAIGGDMVDIPLESLRTTAYLEPGQSLEIWLLGQEAWVTEPVAWLGTVEATRIASLAVSGNEDRLVVRLADIASLDDVLDRQGELVDSIEIVSANP